VGQINDNTFSALKANMQLLDWFTKLGTAIDPVTPLPLPTGEDQFHEFKSSKITDDDLRKKLCIAASAFWNAGGGLFVCGANSQGVLDDGRPLLVGKQSLRDWVDQCIASVHPVGPYDVKVLSIPTVGTTPGNGILLVRFFESSAAPHMAQDNRYYLRTGAHSVPAAAFIVEALFSRRRAGQPLLRHLLRMNPIHGRAIQLGVIAASENFALDVELHMPAMRLIGKEPKTFIVGAIGPDAPFYLDIDFLILDGKPLEFEASISYHDSAGRRYHDTFRVNTDTQMGPSSYDHTGNRLVNALKDIEGHLGSIAHQLPDWIRGRH